MSLDQVEVLMERMKSDADFRDRVLAIEDVDARMQFLGTEGYPCRTEDVQLYLHNYVGKEGNQVVVLTERGGCNKIYYGFCF